MKASNWTPAFAGETNIRKAWFLVVIPAEAGIQDDLKKMESSLDNFGLISISAAIFFSFFSSPRRRKPTTAEQNQPELRIA